jgi:hypothetical protein
VRESVCEWEREGKRERHR